MTSFDQLDQARSLFEKGKYEDAVGIYQTLLSAPHDEMTYFIIMRDMGFLYHKLERYEEALQHLHEALSQDIEDEDGRIHRIVGYCYIALHQPETAVEYLEEALHLHTEADLERYMIMFTLGRTYFLIGDHGLAMQQLQGAEPYFKTHEIQYYGTILYHLGLIRFEQQEIEVADHYFDQILSQRNMAVAIRGNALFGKMLVANQHEDGDQMIEYASQIHSENPDFEDMESLKFLMLKAFQYQRRELEYETLLDEFMNDFPDGRYADQYDDLKKYEFKPIIG